MRRTISFIAAAGAIAFGQTLAAAGPPTHSSPNGSQSTTTATPNSPTGNGGGYNHMNSPQHTTGQPMQSCETTGTTPGNSGSAPGGGSPFTGDSSTSGQNYAGSAPQNSRNTASVSQYDQACAKQPQ